MAAFGIGKIAMDGCKEPGNARVEGVNLMFEMQDRRAHRVAAGVVLLLLAQAAWPQVAPSSAELRA